MVLYRQLRVHICMSTNQFWKGISSFDIQGSLVKSNFCISTNQFWKGISSFDIQGSLVKSNFCISNIH